jgi:hypothetical protein
MWVTPLPLPLPLPPPPPPPPPPPLPWIDALNRPRPCQVGNQETLQQTVETLRYRIREQDRAAASMKAQVDEQAQIIRLIEAEQANGAWHHAPWRAYNSDGGARGRALSERCSLNGAAAAAQEHAAPASSSPFSAGSDPQQEGATQQAQPEALEAGEAGVRHAALAGVNEGLKQENGCLRQQVGATCPSAGRRPRAIITVMAMIVC